MAVPCDLNALRLSKWCAHGARMSSADREWLGCCGSESDDYISERWYHAAKLAIDGHLNHAETVEK
jgi:hypothetical protein